MTRLEFVKCSNPVRHLLYVFVRRIGHKLHIILALSLKLLNQSQTSKKIDFYKTSINLEKCKN